jgi:hypothetical protein
MKAQVNVDLISDHVSIYTSVTIFLEFMWRGSLHFFVMQEGGGQDILFNC